MEPERPDRRGRRRSLPISLRTLLIVGVLLAGSLCGLLAGPEWLSYTTGALLCVASATALTVGVLYGGGYLRTFCVGALFPVAVMFSAFFLGFPIWLDLWTGGLAGRNPSTKIRVTAVVGAFKLLAVGFGLSAVGVRRLLEKSHRP